MKVLTQLKSNARKASIDLTARLAEIEDLNVGWYAIASRAFPAGTVEGDLIRSQIPTFENGATTPTPTPTPTPSPTP